MYVCICNAIKEKQILAAIDNGDDTLEKLQTSLDVATCCGGCQPMIEGYLEEAKAGQVVVEENSSSVAMVGMFIPNVVIAAA